MEWLNYHHLFYFYTVAKEGSVSRAAEKLRVSQPSISAQIKTFEETSGQQLFVKKGRGLIMSDFGKLLFADAEKIFFLGSEVIRKMKEGVAQGGSFLSIGVIDSIPKVLVSNVVSNFLKHSPNNRAYCREGPIEYLLSLLVEGKLDLILADTRSPSYIKIKVHSHLLGKTKLAIYGHSSQAPFQTNKTMPFILPINNSGVRNMFEKWVEEQKIKHTVVAEVEDSALLKLLVSKGHGLMCETAAVEFDLWQRYKIKKFETINKELTYYAITMDRKIRSDYVNIFVDLVKKSLTK